ncbi:hypothetical protein ACFRK5_03560 [Streptomyces niveus]|uniref:hypothetical protein n=1 Tax=Streptomyces niveus TaxID=193462 RepID=UPI003689434E
MDDRAELTARRAFRPAPHPLMSDEDNRRAALGDQGERRFYGTSEDGVGLLRFVFRKRGETSDGDVREMLATQSLSDR